jgi:hypothetical protein
MFGLILEKEREAVSRRRCKRLEFLSQVQAKLLKPLVEKLRKPESRRLIRICVGLVNPILVLDLAHATSMSC